MNLNNLRQFDFTDYTITVFVMIVLEVLKAITAFLVIKVLSKIKLTNPFTLVISRNLDKICYTLFGLWILTNLFNVHIKGLSKSIAGIEQNLIPTEFILLAGVVYIFSLIFKKGVELQSENELTV